MALLPASQLLNLERDHLNFSNLLKVPEVGRYKRKLLYLSACCDQRISQMYSQISVARQEIRISSRDLIVGVNQSQSGQQPEQALLFSITDGRVPQLLSRYSGVVDFDGGVAKEESGSRSAPIPQNENACVSKRAGQGQPRRLIRQTLLPLEETPRWF